MYYVVFKQLCINASCRYDLINSIIFRTKILVIIDSILVLGKIVLGDNTRARQSAALTAYGITEATCPVLVIG